MPCLQVVPFLLLTCLQGTLGRDSLRGKVPNWNMVRHPCRGTTTWAAVGYQDPNAGGDFNIFGEDFENYGSVWNEQLCEADSDQDGMTNGEELGDPDCQWREGHVVFLAPKGHPAVCEPTWSLACKQRNRWLKHHCRPDTSCFKFDLYNHCGNCFVVEPRFLTIPPRPDRRAFYTCQRFNLRMAGQLVGMRPMWRSQIRYNPVEEIAIYGCKAEASRLEQMTSVYDIHRECNALPPDVCAVQLFRWRREWGDSGYCLSGPVGFNIDPSNGYDYIFIQHKIVPMADLPVSTMHSIELFIEAPGVRPHNAASLTVGPAHVVIPPGRQEVNESGYCSANCLRNVLREDFTIAAVDIKMDKLGRKMVVAKWKDGVYHSTIVEQSRFTLTEPSIVTLDTPLTLQLDEEVRVTCSYDSSDRTTVIYEDDEICMATLVYYPAQTEAMAQGLSMSRCVSYNEIDTCHVVDMQTNQKCDMDAFYSQQKSGLLREVINTCYANAAPVCTEPCKALLEQAYRQHDCLRGDMKYAFMDHLLSRPYIRQEEMYSKIEFDRTVHARMTACHGKVMADQIAKVDPKPASRYNMAASDIYGQTSVLLSIAWALTALVVIE